MTEKTWEKLADAEKNLTPKSNAPSFCVRKETMIRPSADYETPVPTPVITREKIEERISAYLDVAERVPGGLGYAWGKVCVHLRIDELNALDQTGDSA